MSNTIDSDGATHTGAVKWFDAEKGYGFVTAQGLDKDVFLHVKQLRLSGITETIADGQQLTFVCNTGPKGLFATKVAKAAPAPSGG